jgi:hypothetical protein
MSRAAKASDHRDHPGQPGHAQGQDRRGEQHRYHDRGHDQGCGFQVQFGVAGDFGGRTALAGGVAAIGVLVMPAWRRGRGMTVGIGVTPMVSVGAGAMRGARAGGGRWLLGGVFGGFGVPFHGHADGERRRRGHDEQGRGEPGQ